MLRAFLPSLPGRCRHTDPGVKLLPDWDWLHAPLLSTKIQVPCSVTVSRVLGCSLLIFCFHFTFIYISTSISGPGAHVAPRSSAQPQPQARARKSYILVLTTQTVRTAVCVGCAAAAARALRRRCCCPATCRSRPHSVHTTWYSTIPCRFPHAPPSGHSGHRLRRWHIATRTSVSSHNPPARTHDGNVLPYAPRCKHEKSPHVRPGKAWPVTAQVENGVLVQASVATKKKTSPEWPAPPAQYLPSYPPP